MNTVTININGCTVTVPADQEQLYREFLADKWINGYRVYVENGMVRTQMRTDTDVMDLDTMEALLIEKNHKRYALAGKL